MVDFQQKRKLRSVMYHRTTLIVLGIVALLIIHSTWSVFMKERESSELREVAEKKQVDLEQNNTLIQQKITDLQTNTGLEDAIRTKFSVAKPDEHVVVVLDNGDDDQNASTTTSLWQKFLNLFDIK